MLITWQEPESSKGSKSSTGANFASWCRSTSIAMDIDPKRGVMLCSFLSFALLHADTSDCPFPLLPHPHIRACVLLWFNLTATILSYCLMPCTISIWCCNTILSIPMYDTYLRATYTTTSSIRGVSIPIYLVSSTTDSLWQSIVVFNLYQYWT